MRNTDQMLTRYIAEIEDKQTFMDGIVEAAQNESRDLNPQEMELVTRARDRIAELNTQLEPLADLSRISGESQRRLAEIHRNQDNGAARTQAVEYRSAGEYILDVWKAGLGAQEAINRLDLYNRAASHQTTADNPGLLPTPILGPVINFIDAARPVVSALGPRQLPGASFSRPKVTQHTKVQAQAGEKTELVSQKMTIGKLAVTPTTLGGYVNVSRQDIDWTQPAVMDLVISDLAAQYAIQTEAAAVQSFYTAATAAVTGITIAGITQDQVAAAFWGAAAQVYAGVKGQGRLLAAASPDVLGVLGGLFAPVNPFNAQGEGFSAGQFGQGMMGTIGGIPVFVTSGFAAAKSLMVLSSAAAEVYEDRIGSLQVVEPSVLGVQVAYAGYFADLVTEPLGIIKVTVT